MLKWLMTACGVFFCALALLLAVTQSRAQTKPDDPPSAATASDRTACQDYANTAVAQNERNRRRGCGLSGPRWLSDADAQFNWCIAATPQQRKAEADARSAELAACRSSAPSGEREARCRDYASHAVDQNAENERRGCSLSGPHWMPEFSANFDWCMNADWKERRAEDAARQKELQSCRASQGSGADLRALCADYASQALAKARQNRRFGCGFSGPGVRWVVSYTDHYRWCLAASAEERQAQAIARERRASRCAQKPVVQVLACRAYAHQAIAAQRENIAKACGLTGPRWQPDYDNHFLWCLNTTSGLRTMETRTRMEAISRCRGGIVAFYQYRWEKVSGSGGPWVSDWVRDSREPLCQHATRECACPGQDRCGFYRNGDETRWFPEGCGAPAWTIRCTVMPQ